MSELHPSKRENRKARPAGIVSDRRTSAKPVGEFAPTVPSESVALKSVGSFLRTAREALGLTQDQLALKTSQNPWPVSRAMIGAIEQGKHAPNPFTLLGISQVLRIDPMEVFDRLKLAVARPKEVAGRDYAALDQLFKDTFASGDFRRSLAILDATMDQLVGSGSSSEETMHRRTLVELRRATTLRRLGALTAARAAAERVLNAADCDAALLSDGYTILAEILAGSGNSRLAVDVAERAVQVAPNDALEVKGRAWLVTGRVLYSIGRYGEAYEAHSKAKKFLSAGGDAVSLIAVAGNQGNCLLRQGRAREARLKITDAVERARRLLRPSLEALWLVQLGNLEKSVGDLDRAWRCAEIALNSAQGLENWLTVFRAAMLAHRIARLRNPSDPDRHRVAYMKRLLGWIEENVEDPELQEFLDELRSTAGGKEKGDK